jgi:short-subunit dehydrogenase
MSPRKFAIVTGASSGIGLHLGRLAAQNGYDLLIASDEPGIEDSADEFRRLGATVTAVECDLSIAADVEQLYAKAGARPIDALFANAGHGLGHAFVDQSFKDIRHVIDTNVMGTTYLLHKVLIEMKARGAGRVLVTGSIAGFIPGAYQAVYNASKAFIDSFCLAVRSELEGTGVSITCLMPGATETEFFERAELMDTKVGQSKKADAADVAKDGWDAMMRGDAKVVSGWRNKLEVAMTGVTPMAVLADRHREMTKPGSGDDPMSPSGRSAGH